MIILRLLTVLLQLHATVNDPCVVGMRNMYTYRLLFISHLVYAYSPVSMDGRTDCNA